MDRDEIDKIKRTILPSTKIFYAAVVRIYYAHPDPSAWSYSGREGGLAFVKDKTTGLYYFRLVELRGAGAVVWEHELYEGFMLNEDRPFFHSFAGDVSAVRAVIAMLAQPIGC